MTLAAFLAEKEDEGAIDIELDDGTSVRIPPPELWSDDVIALVDAGDNPEVARHAR